MYFYIPRPLLFALLVVGLLPIACSRKAGPQKPPVEVSIITLQPRSLTMTTELPGRTEPYRIAEVRPQVGGIILKRMFEEGSEVEAGQQLYQIDPQTYQAAYDSATANLARAEATLTAAKLLAERYQPLVAKRAVSKQEYDNAVASQLQAAADVAACKAAQESAAINLAYTKVTSPISGRIGRSLVTEGALVTANQIGFLAVVQQLNPIYVDVTQSSNDLLQLKRDIANGRFKQVSDNQIECSLILEDGTPYDASGKLQFSEVTVNRQTGSVTLRALFPNDQGILLPGMFVHARVAEGVREQALLVPQQAISRNNRGEPMVWIVDANNQPQLKTIRANRALGDEWLVEDGLQAGDKIVVEGWQKLDAKSEVKATEIPLSQISANAK